MDYDLNDVCDDFEAQYADEMDAMEDMGPEEDDVDPWSNYKVSDEMIQQALAEEAQKLASGGEKENVKPAKSDNNISPSKSSHDPLEKQLQSIRESLGTSSSLPDPQSQDSYPIIEFSFMSNNDQQNPAQKSTNEHLPPVRISNAYKRRTGSDEFGVPLQTVGNMPLDDEEKSASKRPKTDPEREKVHKKAPIGDFIRVYGDEGMSRVYLKIKPSIPTVKLASSSDSLLAQPFHYLKSQVMRDYYEKKAEVTAAVERHMSHVLPARNSAPQDDNLWVNTYLPRNYVELLSDDGVNRQVLHWIKLWDGVVFGRKMKEKVAPTRPKWQSEEDFQRYLKFQEPEYDPQGFPFKKTILLAGPPGLGKTTLAHVIAKHAGYNVVEMNASDERNATQFTESIENATRMSAALDRDNKPNCLVIDEIDGAGAPAVQVLIKVLTAGTINKTELDTGKKKKKEVRLRRPIICICNDPYVPALRDLRKVATIVHFPHTQSARLAYRLKSVCTMEKLTADMSTLLYLCEKTDNDIRSSLNTLQFMKTKKEPLSMVRLRGMDIGVKDIQQSMFKFWNTLFTLPKSKVNALSMDSSQRHDQKRLIDLMKLVSSTGDYDKQINGVHENFLRLKIRDANFPVVADSFDWFIFYDVIGYEIEQTMLFELYTYLMYVPLAFHFMFAMLRCPKLQNPTASFQAHQKQQETKEICEMLRRETIPRSRIDLTPHFITTELCSYLVRILTPTFRPINTQFYSDAEKTAKTDLVTTMACYDLQFIQHKTQDGYVQYRLEPDIYGIIKYSDLPEPKHLPYTVKQMLAREVDLKRISGSVDPGTHKTSPSKNKVSAGEDSDRKIAKKPAKIDFSLEKAPVDYMSKIIKNKEALQRKSEAYVQKDRTFFKFNEGFTNAVRKPVKLSSFF